MRAGNNLCCLVCSVALSQLNTLRNVGNKGCRARSKQIWGQLVTQQKLQRLDICPQWKSHPTHIVALMLQRPNYHDEIHE